MIITKLFGFATTKEQKQLLIDFLKAKQIKIESSDIVHDINKTQRYSILRKIFADPDFPAEEKEAMLKEEMNIDYSDVDEL